MGYLDGFKVTFKKWAGTAPTPVGVATMEYP